ncbi:MAG: hypothetical protein ACE5GB_07890, partial [Acidimicrobiales bacterium]
NRFHTATPAAAAALLKTIEEPPTTSIFVVVSDEVPPEQVTVASRCVRIDFPPVPGRAIVEALVDEGLTGEADAEVVAAAAAGNVDRARLLATDERLAARRQAWWSVPDRLDGSGASVAVLVEEVRGLIDDALGPLVARHAGELEALAQREERLGTRGSGRRDLEARHRREQRQFRTEELRFGLATIVSRYRERILAGDWHAADLEAIDRVGSAAEALVRNPNEALLLQALLVDLPGWGSTR